MNSYRIVGWGRFFILEKVRNKKIVIGIIVENLKNMYNKNNNI